MPQSGDFIQNKTSIGKEITIRDKWGSSHEAGLAFMGTIMEDGMSYFSTADGTLLSQHVQFIKTKDFGIVFILDGSIMTIERPEMEASYHEIIAHIPLIEHSHPKKILIIGGGDGGVAREVLKHEMIEQCTLVEIDKNVIELSKKYTPSIAKALLENNPKLQILTQDGIQYLKDIKPSSFDIIINDLTDPDEGEQISEKLFGEAFYRTVYEALDSDGIMITLGQSCVSDSQDAIRDIYNNIAVTFSNTIPILNNVIMYQPDFLFFMAAKDSKKQWNNLNDSQKERQNSITKQCIIYNENMHRSVYGLKNYVRKILFNA